MATVRMRALPPSYTLSEVTVKTRRPAERRLSSSTLTRVIRDDLDLVTLTLTGSREKTTVLFTVTLTLTCRSALGRANCGLLPWLVMGREGKAAGGRQR